MIMGLLNFLENNDWQMIFAAHPNNAIEHFFKLVQTNDLEVVVKWISSMFQSERKKKNFTIVGKSGNVE